MRIIVCEPGKQPEVREAGKMDLETMQGLVGGNIECVGVGVGVDLWFHEEGRLRRLPFNRNVPDERGQEWDIIGPLFLCGVDEDEGESVGLTDGQIESWLPKLVLPVIEVPEVPEGCIAVWHAKHPNFAGSYMWDIQPPPPWPQDFEQVALVLTESIDHAYRQTNHIESAWQTNTDVKALKGRARSSSVGDVFVLPGGKAMRVDSIGFVEVTDGS
jgi:hypothetical protein